MRWQTISPPAGCAGTGSDHTIAYDAGRLFLTASSTPKANFSDDNGATWSSTCGQQATGAEVSWNADRANGGRWTPDIAGGSVGSDGTIYVPKQFCGEPYLAMSGAHPLIYSATTTPSNYPWYTGAGGPDRAPLHCGCDYVGEATASTGATWSLTFDQGTNLMGALASVLSPPPATTKSGG